MGSSVSCTRQTKVAETSIETKGPSRKMEDNTESDKSGERMKAMVESGKNMLGLGQSDANILNNGTDKQALVTDKKGDDDDGKNDKDNNKSEQPKEDLMTEEELQTFRSSKFEKLRDTANATMKLKDRKDAGGEFNMQIRNATLNFTQSYFSLRKGKLNDIEQYRKDVAEIIIDTKFFNLVTEIISDTYKNGWIDKDGNLIEKKTRPLINSLLILLNFSDCSDSLSIAIANEHGLLETLKQIIIDSQDRHFKEKEPPLDTTDEKILKHSLSIFHNCSMRETNAANLRDIDLVTVSQPYLKSPNEFYALNVLATLAGIINEEECEIITGNKNVVKVLLNCLRVSMKDKMRRCRGWSSKECGFTVRMLARNDANMKMLVDLGALELLVELGRTGNDMEQYESVAALWALCFDKNNQTLIATKPELGVVDLLVDLKKSENSEIKRCCDGALWTLREALNKTTVENYKDIGGKMTSQRKSPMKQKKKEDESEKKQLAKGHIMISYQWADQQVLKKVRDRIKAKGYKVWMDIDQMGGSTLQAMADAVEGADAFLMCMSNKYKHSAPCRAEAEYAFQTRKKIIPLKMERGYVPDGWLGFILGSKLFYEFSPKYPFEDKIVSLIKELDQVLLGEVNETPSTEEVITPVSAGALTTAAGPHTDDYPDSAPAISPTVARLTVCKVTIDNIRKWSESDVKNWITKNDLQTCGVSKLTGGEVALLACMRVECPEYFYKCLHDMLKVNNLLNMSKIVWALNDLT